MRSTIKKIKLASATTLLICVLSITSKSYAKEHINNVNINPKYKTEKNEEKEFNITEKEVNIMAQNFLDQLEDNNIEINLPLCNEIVPLNKEHVISLIYWCNYEYLSDIDKVLACNMDFAGLAIGIISREIDLVGLTSKRIGNFPNLPEDEIDKYNINLGELFIEGTNEEKEVSSIYNKINYIKNNPSKTKAYSSANAVMNYGIKNYIEDNNDLNDQANFVIMETIATSQSIQTTLNSKKYLNLVDELNGINGQVNKIARTIDNRMNEHIKDMILKLR